MVFGQGGEPIPEMTVRWLLGGFEEYEHFDFCSGLAATPAAADPTLFRCSCFHAGTGVYTFELESSTRDAINTELHEIALQASSTAVALDSDCSPVNSSESDGSLPDADDAVVISNVGGYHSKQDFLQWDHPACSRLSTVIGSALRVVALDSDALADHGASLGADESWANVSFDGDYNAVHDHEGFTWSGVYYVATADPMLNWCAHTL